MNHPIGSTPICLLQHHHRPSHRGPRRVINYSACYGIASTAIAAATANIAAAPLKPSQNKH